MLCLLLAASSQASETITVESENMYWIERDVSKGEVIDIRFSKVNAAFAVVVSDSKFYLDIGTNCHNINPEFRCEHWGNAKQNGLYGLCLKTNWDQQNLIFTAAQPGRVRLIAGSAYLYCYAKLSVVSGRTVSSWSLPSGQSGPIAAHCVFSGDLGAQLSVKTEGKLDTQVTVEARYLNTTVLKWTGETIDPPVASDFVRVISGKSLSSTLEEPTLSSQGSPDFDFGDHKYGDYYGDKHKCLATYLATGWTTGGTTVEILDGKHVEEPDPEPETVSSEDETDVESSASESDDPSPLVSEPDDPSPLVSESDDPSPLVSEPDDGQDLIDASSSGVSDNGDPKGDGPNVGAIVGGSVGGLGCVSCVMVFVFVCWNRKQDSEKDSVSHDIDDEVPETQQDGSEDIPGF